MSGWLCLHRKYCSPLTLYSVCQYHVSPLLNCLDCLNLSNKVHLLVVKVRMRAVDQRSPKLWQAGWCVCVRPGYTHTVHSNPATLTSVMAFRAVSEPMLRSEPGILLETVAGTITIGTQSSVCLSRAAESSSNPTYACSSESQRLIGCCCCCWRCTDKGDEVWEESEEA